MARYSPRDPGYTPVPGFFDALTHIATSGATGYTGVKEKQKAEGEAERLRAQQDEERELEFFGQGFRRGRAPAEPVPEGEDIFAGAGMGMQPGQPTRPSIFQGARPGMASGTAPASQTQAALGSIADMGAQPPQPTILALPGSYVEGMGFTPRTITDQDFVAATQSRNAAPRTRPRPGYEQVTDDRYFEEAGSPEGREEARVTRRDTAERARLESALGQLGGDGIDPAVQAELLGSGVPGGTLFPNSDDATITLGGRKFENTPAGQAAAVAWQETLAEARRDPNAGTASGTTSRNTTRRQIAMSAARAMQSLRDDVRDMTPFERRNLPAGYLQQQIQEVVEQFGYTTPQEVEEEMRELRLSSDGAPAAGGGGEITDELIARLVEENPELSAEEIMALAEEEVR